METAPNIPPATGLVSYPVSDAALIYGQTDPIEQHAFDCAAYGDRASLVALAMMALDDGCYRCPPPKAEALAAAEAFARLAVVHGVSSDMLLLADILAHRATLTANRFEYERRLIDAADWSRKALEAGNPAGATYLATLLSMLSDDGHELAAVELNRLMERLGPEEADKVRSEIQQIAASATR